MSPIGLREVMRRARRRNVVLAVALLVALSVVVHHSAPMHPGMHMAAAQVCVAVLGLGALALALNSRSVSLLPPPRAVFLPLVSQMGPSPQAPAARAGPVRLQVLRL